MQRGSAKPGKTETVARRKYRSAAPACGGRLHSSATIARAAVRCRKNGVRLTSMYSSTTLGTCRVPCKNAAWSEIITFLPSPPHESQALDGAVPARLTHRGGSGTQSRPTNQYLVAAKAVAWPGRARCADCAPGARGRIGRLAPADPWETMAPRPSINWTAAGWHCILCNVGLIKIKTKPNQAGPGAAPGSLSDRL